MPGRSGTPLTIVMTAWGELRQGGRAGRAGCHPEPAIGAGRLFYRNEQVRDRTARAWSRRRGRPSNGARSTSPILSLAPEDAW